MEEPINLCDSDSDSEAPDSDLDTPKFMKKRAGRTESTLTTKSSVDSQSSSNANGIFNPTIEGLDRQLVDLPRHEDSDDSDSYLDIQVPSRSFIKDSREHENVSNTTPTFSRVSKSGDKHHEEQEEKRQTMGSSCLSDPYPGRSGDVDVDDQSVIELSDSADDDEKIDECSHDDTSSVTERQSALRGGQMLTNYSSVSHGEHTSPLNDTLGSAVKENNFHVEFESGMSEKFCEDDSSSELSNYGPSLKTKKDMTVAPQKDEIILLSSDDENDEKCKKQASLALSCGSDSDHDLSVFASPALFRRKAATSHSVHTQELQVNEYAGKKRKTTPSENNGSRKMREAADSISRQSSTGRLKDDRAYEEDQDSDDILFSPDSQRITQHERSKRSADLGNNIEISRGVGELGDRQFGRPAYSPGVTFNNLDLMSPVASIGRPPVGSAQSVSTNNSRRKVKVQTPPIPVVNINQIGGRLYPDLRHQFIQALIKHARRARNALHQKTALDGTIRAINKLALYPYPIRTPEAAGSIKGIGRELQSILNDAQNILKDKKKKPYNPPIHRFSSAAAAALVALLDYENEKNQQGALCPMETLIAGVNLKGHSSSRTTIFDRDIPYYLDKNTVDPGWMQIRKLCGAGEDGNYVKERKRKGTCVSGVVYELLEDGRREALMLKQRAALGVPPPGPLRQLASNTVDEEFGNVTISMDFREGGGGKHKLHEMCNFFDEYQIPYVVRNLKISDYVFFVGNKLAPVLIERKSIEDVAYSLHDGRWERQQRSMRKAQYVLGGGEERKCHICYLIEGDIDRTTVHGGYVGRRSYGKTIQDVKDAIDSLPELGFSVITSKNKFGSLHKIKRIAQEFLWLANNGSIDCTYTYDDFVAAEKRLQIDKGDPPQDARHKNPAPPIVDLNPALSAAPLSMIGHEIASGDNTNNDNVDDSRQKMREELLKLSMKELKERCKERGDKTTGKKSDLVSRLLQKRRPEILLTRARRNQYVPKVPSCNAAILVALHLHHEPGTPPLSKQQIMLFAEETGVSKDPMFGNGKSWYDGWSGLKDMTGGDPPLISVVKRKYALTTQPYGCAGVDVARAIHIMAHRQNLCTCGNFVDIE